ncbi:MAG: hydroxylamine reductase, partial [Pseudomonadota bacterium]
MFNKHEDEMSRSDETVGCSATAGGCDVDSNASALQNLLVYQLMGIAAYARRARALGTADISADRFIIHALSITVTRRHYDADGVVRLLQEAAQVHRRVKTIYEQTAWVKGTTIERPGGPAAYTLPADTQALFDEASAVSVSGFETAGEELRGLHSLLLSGLKGVAAHAHHAFKLGKESDEVYKELERLLDYPGSAPTDIETMLEKALNVGTLNLMVMELLDEAITGRFGAPKPTRVRVAPVAGKAILVSGHDMADLAALLEATEDSGIHIYTHGDLLSAHSYPELRKFPHLVGNYGGSWQAQQWDFDAFPGPILVDSNCLIEPGESYRERLFTLGRAGRPGIHGIENNDFSALIEAARILPGFRETAENLTVTTGFSGDAVQALSGRLTGAIREGAIRHLFLLGGCNGTSPGHHYYSEFVECVPRETVILTLGCIKHRFNGRVSGAIGAIPRLLDVGQCHDSYSMIKLAVTMTEGLECRLSE